MTTDAPAATTKFKFSSSIISQSDGQIANAVTPVSSLFIAQFEPLVHSEFVDCSRLFGVTIIYVNMNARFMLHYCCGVQVCTSLNEISIKPYASPTFQWNLDVIDTLLCRLTSINLLLTVNSKREALVWWFISKPPRVKAMNIERQHCIFIYP